MAKTNWVILATYPNGGDEPHEILVNTANLSTQGTVNAKIRRTLELVQQKQSKITVLDKKSFLKVCTNEGVDYKQFKGVINFK